MGDQGSFGSAGSAVNLAAFAQVLGWTGTACHDLCAHDVEPDADGPMRPMRDPESGLWHLGLEWDEPRDVRQVVVRFAGGPSPDVRVEYWQHTWPTPAPERLPGARRGWIGRDDPWHGQWVTARGDKEVTDATVTFTFDPIDWPELRGIRSLAELEEAEHYLARFRRTLKLRLVSEDALPPVAELQAFSGTCWRDVDIDVKMTNDEWRMMNGEWRIVNGYLLDATPIEDVGSIDGEHETMRLCVRAADCAADAPDRTIVTLDAGTRGFSFLVADLERGPIYIRYYGVYITQADGEPFKAFQQRLADAPASIYDRVFDEPEHSLARAMAETPPLDVVKHNSYTGLGRYLPLGIEAGRQEFALRHNGELFVDKAQLKLAGRDAARLLWPGAQMRVRFGTGDPPDFRESGYATAQSLRDGWLPVVTSRWLDREIAVEETTFVTLLDGPLTGPDVRRGDEDVVAMLRFTLCNTTHGRKRAHLWIVIGPQEQLALREGLILAQGRIVPGVSVARGWRVDLYEEPRLRGIVHTGGRGTVSTVPYAEEGTSQAIPTAVLYTVDLEGGASHALTLAVPFVTLTDATAMQLAAAVDFDHSLADVVTYWRAYVQAGGQMDAPEAVLADFHKAARVHVGIGVDKDPVNGLYVVPAATWSYGACGNEATWQITMLDQAGHHDRAAAYLETFLRTQGMIKPDGRFASAEGALVAVDFDGGTPVMGGFAYNLDHGYIMACLADHYRYSDDRAWLDRVTPHLIAACEFVIRERTRTQRHDPDGQPMPEWGLLPAGHLEDNPEWRHWFAVNAHAYAGMQAIAEVLTSVEHPDAARLTREAAAYREDIRRAARRAMVASPVVRLLDGTYGPHIPTRTGIRGRAWGWFREAAYGALHLLEGGVFEPNEVEMTWVLKDLEDNLFVSREWGRPVDLEKAWFSHGGVTIQPNLMDLGIDYLRRGEVKHALRALFNNFGSELYPDVRAFAEHPVTALGHGVGPFYKSPDECKALIWLRHFLLHEEGATLHLAMGAPRAWFAPGQTFGVRDMATFFGPVTYYVESGPAEIRMEITLSDARPPHVLLLHLRRAKQQTLRAVTVNGQRHTDFDPADQVIRISNPERRLSIVAQYEYP